MPPRVGAAANAAVACAALVVTAASPPQTVLCSQGARCVVDVGWAAADAVNATSAVNAEPAGWSLGAGAPTAALGPGPAGWYEPLAAV